MYCDKVSSGPQLAQLHKLNVELCSHFRRNDRVIPNCLWRKNKHEAMDTETFVLCPHLHSKGLHARGDFTTNSPQTDNCQGFPLQFNAHELLTIPAPLLQRGAALGNVSGGTGEWDNEIFQRQANLAKDDMRAHVCSVALIVLPPGVLIMG